MMRRAIRWKKASHPIACRLPSGPSRGSNNPPSSRYNLPRPPLSDRNPCRHQCRFRVVKAVSSSDCSAAYSHRVKTRLLNPLRLRQSPNQRHPALHAAKGTANAAVGSVTVAARVNRARDAAAAAGAPGRGVSPVHPDQMKRMPTSRRRKRPKSRTPRRRPVKSPARMVQMAR